MNPTARVIPPHVPAERVVDFDYYDIPGMEADAHLAWRDRCAGLPALFWTPHHGGHWVATRAEDIERVLVDHQYFSTAKNIIPFPDTPISFIPLELEPPEHGKYRKLLNPAFSPAAIMRMEDRLRRVATHLVAAIEPKGGCEFREDFADKMPVTVFLELLGLPIEDRAIVQPLAQALTRETDLELLEKARTDLASYLDGWITLRLTEPRDDFLSVLVHSTVDGAPVPRAKLLGICTFLLGAGHDTVASMLSFTAKTLAERPDARRMLREEPSRINMVIEEILRRHALGNVGRLVVSEVQIDGVTLQPGDCIMAPTTMHGMDSERFPDAERIDFDRPNAASHATFGKGPHRCAGALLAKREIAIFMEEWLRSIPDFSLKLDGRFRQASGMSNTVLELDLIWEPAGSGDDANGNVLSTHLTRYTKLSSLDESSSGLEPSNEFRQEREG